MPGQELEIPANTSAIVVVPVCGRGFVTESGVPAGKAAGVSLLAAERDAIRCLVASGTYRFHSC